MLTAPALSVLSASSARGLDSPAMDKLGIERRAITSESTKRFDPFSPLTSDMKKFWEGVLSKTHQQFIERVKAGRGDRLKDDPEVFWIALEREQAKDIGLIDGLGSLNSVARDVIHQSNLVDYTPTEDIIRDPTSEARSQFLRARTQRCEVY